MAKVTSIKKSISDQIAKISVALSDRVLSKVAEGTGLHVNTVRNIAKNNGQSFSLETIEKLERYLFKNKE